MLEGMESGWTLLDPLKRIPATLQLEKWGVGEVEEKIFEC